VVIYKAAVLAYVGFIKRGNEMTELFMLGANRGVTAGRVDVLTAKAGTYIVREVEGGLFDVYRVRADYPLYNGQVAFIVRRTDTVEVVK
jgi:hypothetical protein